MGCLCCNLEVTVQIVVRFYPSRWNIEVSVSVLGQTLHLLYSMDHTTNVVRPQVPATPATCLQLQLRLFN